MKEQPVETKENGVDYSVGQRPIHQTYEPPNPIPQFRPRPRWHQARLPTRRPTSAITRKLMQTTSPEATGGSPSADSQKSG